MQKNVNIKLYKGIILFILFWKITFYKTCQLKKLNETFIKNIVGLLFGMFAKQTILLYNNNNNI